jgi:hypothetical protein
MEDNVMMKGGEDQVGSLFMAKSGGGCLKESDLENPANLDHDEVRDSELVADCKEDYETFTSIMGDMHGGYYIPDKFDGSDWQAKIIFSEDDDSEARSMKGVMKKCSQNCSSQEKLAVSE